MSSGSMSMASPQILQQRYEKAIKQIDKLIEINRQIKAESIQIADQSHQLRASYDNLFNQHQASLAEIKTLKENLNSYVSSFKDMEIYCHKLDQELKNVTAKSLHYKDLLQQQTFQFQEARDQNIQKLEAIASQHAQAARNYEEILSKLQESLKVQEKTNVVLMNEIQQLKQAKELLTSQKSEIEEKVKESGVDDYKAKLLAAEEWIQKLSAECNSLKNTQICIEVQEEKSKLQKEIGFTGNNQQAVKDLIYHYQKKIKGLQLEKKEVVQKYKQLKHQQKKEKDGDNSQRKIEGLERLINKQQMQIQRIIDIYDSELRNRNHDSESMKTMLASQINTMRKEVDFLTSELNMKNSQIVGLQQSMKLVLSTPRSMEFDKVQKAESVGVMNSIDLSQSNTPPNEKNMQFNKTPSNQWLADNNYLTQVPNIEKIRKQSNSIGQKKSQIYEPLNSQRMYGYDKSNKVFQIIDQ